MKRFKMPNDFVLAVTYNCNSRCRMCNIWKKEPLPLLGLEQYKKLPSTVKDVNLTGGEPFLRPDLVEIVRILNSKNPRARLTISSNGFATDLIEKQIIEILKIKPDIRVSISLDGIGNIHDEIRGIPGGYEKVLKTITILKKTGVKNIKVAFTAGDYNIGELNKVYKLSRDLDVGFTLAAVHNADNYFNAVDNKITKKEEFRKEFEYLINQELASLKPLAWPRAYFAFALLDFIETGKRLLPSYSGRDSVFMDPLGEVYPSDVSGHKMGNIKFFPSFVELYNSKVAQAAVELEKENQNWMICTARSAIKRHPFKVMAWIIKNKIFGFKF